MSSANRRDSRDCDFHASLTPVLPGSGSKGYLIMQIHQALSPPQADTPSIEASLTEGRSQVKLGRHNSNATLA
jgi:hypothetical protein